VTTGDPSLCRPMSAEAVLRNELVRVRLLNGFTVTHGDISLDLKPGAQRLVAYLALVQRAVERRFVAFQLWPDSREERAMANLRSALWRLRLLPVMLVDATTTHLALNGKVWVDTRQDLSEEICAVVPDQAFPGELLPDWYDDWIVVERERIRQGLLHALESACTMALAQDRHGDAIDLALRAVAMEPLRESAHRLVIMAHLREGNRYEAQRYYAHLVRTFREELNIEPSVSFRKLFDKAPRHTAAAGS
jgi:DNA-binding SARP family transcriptional activator